MTTDFKNAPAGLPGAAISTHTGSNTRDANHSNDARRIFTWAWGGHLNLKGFSYGSSVYSGADSATNFLWEGNNQGHTLAYTEVYIP
ncbi:hypothetical protein [Rubritalea profundi]|uniref:Uncharacterized protein n=1 Tax=Rubritalea profundi TaxID=1658618 RepID=A0A2S7TXU4_9BACT|nr:hypothetical protein [Rubritalea profundi]PQJ27586.1 hypothetical protein BSZ32_03145 [Rubritalea profundi]